MRRPNSAPCYVRCPFMDTCVLIGLIKSKSKTAKHTPAGSAQPSFYCTTRFSRYVTSSGTHKPQQNKLLPFAGKIFTLGEAKIFTSTGVLGTFRGKKCEWIDCHHRAIYSCRLSRDRVMEFTTSSPICVSPFFSTSQTRSVSFFPSPSFHPPSRSPPLLLLFLHLLLLLLLIECHAPLNALKSFST